MATAALRYISRSVIRRKLVIAAILSGKQAAEFTYNYLVIDLFCHADYMNMILIWISQSSIIAEKKIVPLNH